MHHSYERLSQQGVTLVEALVSVAILAICASIAVPALTSFKETLKLKGAAAQLLMELRWAQSESIKKSSALSVSFKDENADWCYGFSLGTSCDCNESDSCMIDGELRATDHTAMTSLLLKANVSGKRFTFNPLRGTVTAGNVQLTGSGGKVIRVVVSGMGRIRTCSPSGDSNVGGYPIC